ncbi:helix-turn-helix domain-containing protein [Streptomyces sp. G-G2]|uniref:helix-turn-helix domain-containing protein n=1 Tax=Streptomyces sp. G-G2 TaxID=3046201 RepID=UPI0024B88BE1|nr:helix-turn-helix domain-containing protein [Streptomyces sp. G-G2]MDJ0382109.1 helix-turn-helix domain-containing protein [Streptomyces sp. G-G2]
MAQQALRQCDDCGCRLSQYNPDGLCSACARSRIPSTPALPAVPERVWQDLDVRQALAALDFGKASRLIRQRGSLRQEDMAQLTGLSQAFLSMLESGSRRLTNIDKIIEFVAGIGAPAELLQLPLPRSAGRPLQRPADQSAGDLDPTLPWTAARMVAALNHAVGGDVLDRRQFLTVSGIALTAFVHYWGTAEAEPLQRAADGSQLTSDLLDNLQATTDHLRIMDASAGSGTLTELGDAHLELLKRLLQKASYTEDIGRRLAAIVADTATQTGWFAFDSGRHDHAQSYLLAALRAAKVSGDDRLGAGALSYLAIHGYSTGQPRSAVTAARAAREKIKTLGTPALEAMLLTRQARGHAKLGERQAALIALGEAAELCARGRSEFDPHWLYWINEGEIHGQSGSAYLDLDDAPYAAVSFTEARKALNPADQRTNALFLSRAASAYLRKGELEAGCTTAHHALDLAEQLQSARLNEHIEDMIGELAPVRRSPYARELIDRSALVTGARS